MNCLSRALVLGALLVGGCAPTAPAPTPAEAPPAKPATAPAPATADPGTRADANHVPSTPATPEGDPAQKDPRYNASRVYQLSELRVVPITVGGHKFKAWVMDTGGKRQEGMMFLKDPEVKPDEAMLFVFPEPQPLSFWMHNTLMALDIAYFSKDRRLLNVQTGKPLDDSPLPASGDGQYVVEFKAGTCKRLGIKSGAALTFPSDIRADL